MKDIIIIIAIAIVIGAALFYIIRAKMRGEKCIGCPHSKECSGKCSCAKQEQKSNDDKCSRCK